MSHSKLRWLAAGLGLVFLAGLTHAQRTGQEQPKDQRKDQPKVKPKGPAAKPGAPAPKFPIRPATPAPASPATPKPTAPPSNTPKPLTPPPTYPTKPTETVKPPTKQAEPIKPQTKPRGTDNSPAKKTESVNPPAKPVEPVKLPTAKPPAPIKPVPQPVKLETKPTGNGGQIRTTPSGQVREKMEKKPDGAHTQHFTPTGRVQTEVVQKPDGTRHTTQYTPNGQVQKRVEVNKDGAKQTTNVQYDRNGKERATETIKADTRGREISKTVVVKQTTVMVKNTTIVNNTTVVRNYDRGRYGFVYRPIYVVRSPVFVSWYDPYWYTPAGVLIVHPFRFSWGWGDSPWYHHHRHYWAPYEVYPAPSYWVTDWLIAGYVADQYAASVSFAQAQEDLRLAREDAERARLAAQQARDAAEVAEARAAQTDAERRATLAEAKAAKAEAAEARAKVQGDQPNPNATPIDQNTKDALKDQVEKAIAEKKEIAEQAAKGNTVLPDLSKSLADPKHIYPVSSSISVTLADGNPAGTLTEGDLLRLEPGQENILKDAGENTLVNMRVMTSKGEEGEVKAGSVISLPLKSLQDFDSEFRAKLDLGLAEADKNKDQFKKGI